MEQTYIVTTLKDIRLGKGMTQQNVADQLGIARQAYSSYENRDYKPSADICRKLADVFDVDLATIVMTFYN